MRNLLIIYPHWHPANLAGVHRPRLIGNFLKEHGWQPYVLTVKPEYFEEKPDPNFEKTFSKDFIVRRVDAYKVSKPRIIGDIGLRAFKMLYKEAKSMVVEFNIEFVWLPIPSFYNGILGRLLFDSLKVPYGIDYIDPWVRDLTNQKTFRAMLSQFVAKSLEPYSVKKASLISGVSTPYYLPVLERNFPSFFNKEGQIKDNLINPNTNMAFSHVGMPYGFDPHDHEVKLDGLKYPWDNGKKIWLYAGAFLPNSHAFMDAFFHAISELRKEKLWDESVELWFIGTGFYPSKRITSYAQDYQIDDFVFEDQNRYPFLQILNFLSEADTVMVIGSTEKHYTASKTFQSLLSNKPVISVFHEESSAVKVMEDCKADTFTLRYSPNMSSEMLKNGFKKLILDRLANKEWQVNLTMLDEYSAKKSAEKLAHELNKVT